jgi:hemolysin III
MLMRRRMPMVYSRAEVLSDAVVHAVGLVLALVALPVLVTLAAVWVGDPTTIAAAAIYGISVITMFVCSAIYNHLELPDWKDVLRRLDQSAIYVKIAGSYTPFAVMTGTHAGFFLAGVWGTAVLGASLIILSPTPLKWASILLYLALGWAGALIGGPMLAALSPAGFALIVAAGSIYTAGLFFFLWERLPFHNTIWHLFVLTATFVLYAAVLLELSGRALAS